MFHGDEPQNFPNLLRVTRKRLQGLSTKELANLRIHRTILEIVFVSSYHLALQQCLAEKKQLFGIYTLKQRTYTDFKSSPEIYNIVWNLRPCGFYSENADIDYVYNNIHILYRVVLL